MSDIKSREDLNRSYRSLCLTIASQILMAMAQTDTCLEDIDERLGEKRGEAKRRLDTLIACHEAQLDFVADFATAMDVEFVFGLRKLPEIITNPEPEET